MSDMYQIVMDKASELGELITQTDEYQEVKEKQNMMFQDNSALELLKTYDNLKKQQKEQQENGVELTQDDVNALEQAEAKLNENKNIQEFFQAQNKFQELLNEAMELIIKPCKQ